MRVTVRRSQERLIAAPVLERLARHEGREGAERRLLALIDDWRDRPRAEQGFGPGGEGYVRFALIENEHRIGQAVRTLRRALTKL